MGKSCFLPEISLKIKCISSAFSDNKKYMLAKIKKILKDLGFHENEIKVYIALTQLGESTAATIAKKADLPRTTVIGILEKLQRENYLSEHFYRNANHYWIESPKTIQNSLMNRVKISEELNGLLSDLYRTESDFPQAQIYDTKSSVRNFIEKTIVNLEKKEIIYTIDTPATGNYLKIFSEDHGYSLNKLKKQKGIITQTLVPFGAFKTIKPEKITTQSIVIREMPQEVNFKASLWIIKDRLVLFSGRYPFVVEVRHKIITESIKSIFDFLWNISKSPM